MSFATFLPGEPGAQAKIEIIRRGDGAKARQHLSQFQPVFGERSTLETILNVIIRRGTQQTIGG